MTDASQSKKITTRDSITYDSNGLKIFGVIHRPVQEAHALRPGVVMYHGFVAAKYQPPHRSFVHLAEKLAQRGIVSLRIDLPGRGDSEGDSIDITVDGDLHAAHTAIDILAEQPDVDSARIGLIGVSWGGTLASILAGRDQRVAATVLWSNTPRTSLDWTPQFHTVDGQVAAEIVGNLIGKQFYESMEQLTPGEDLQRTRGPVLMAYGTDDELVSSTEIDQSEHQLTKAGIPTTVIRIEDADHAFSRYVWQQQVVDQTTDWLQHILLQTG